AAVIEVAAAVEHHVLDALLLGALGDELADGLGRRDAGACLQALPRRFFDRRGGNERDAAIVVDHLRVDVLGGAEHRKPLALASGAAQRAAHAPLPPLDPVTELGHRAAPLLLLAFFAEDALVGIFDALALVGLGRPIFADFGGDLPDLLAIDAADHDLNRARRRNRDALRDRIDDIVSVAERELQVLALHRGAIADAVDLEPLFEALGDAGDQIGDQGARRAPLRACPQGVGARIDHDAAALELDRHIVVQHDFERAFRPLHLHGLTRDIGGDPGGDRDWFIADAGHGWLSVARFRLRSRSKYRAEDFAADIGVAGVVIGHDALGCRNAGDAEAIVDAGQIPHRGIDAAARLGNALKLADHRLALEVFQLDLDLRAAFAIDHRVAADVAFRLEHFENAFAQPRVRTVDLGLVAHLRVADAGQKIAERIVHRHPAIPLTSSTSPGRGSALSSR